MRYEEKEKLTRHRDTSDEAVASRLKAAVLVSGLRQKDIAAALGLSTKTLNSQIMKGRPSISLMAFFYREHRIDFNFLLFGDFVQLPGDVQAELLGALADGKLS